MNFLRSIHLGVLVAFLSVMTVYAGEEDFDADKMLSELGTQLKLSGDKLSKLKPDLDAKITAGLSYITEMVGVIKDT